MLPIEGPHFIEEICLIGLFHEALRFQAIVFAAKAFDA